MTADPDFHMQVLTCPALDDNLRQAIIALCDRALEGREEFGRLFYYIPNGVHVLGLLGDRPVSHAVFSTRWMQINSGPLLRLPPTPSFNRYHDRLSIEHHGRIW